jgi:hypothetical protein
VRGFNYIFGRWPRPDLGALLAPSYEQQARLDEKFWRARVYLNEQRRKREEQNNG